VCKMNIWDEYIPLYQILTNVKRRFGYENDVPKWINSHWISKVLDKFNLVYAQRKVAGGIEKMFKKEKVEDIMKRYNIIAIESEEKVEEKTEALSKYT